MLDEKDLSTIYRTHARELLVYVYHFVRSRDTAEDIFQEAFERLIRYSNGNHVDLATVRPFLYRICRNLAIDHLKRSKRTAAMNIEDVHEIPVVERVQDDLEKRELLDRVHELIEHKDPLTRSIFYLKAEFDHTYAEIAAALGISERTVKRKMSALLLYLAEELDRKGFQKLYSILIW